MKVLSNLLLISCCLWASCSNPEPKEAAQNTTQTPVVTDHNAAIGKLNELLKKMEEPMQVYKISSDKPAVVSGKKGTRIEVNPGDLQTESGKPLGAEIEVELQELLNQSGLMRSNAQTVSDGRLLISGGAYYIGMRSGGEPLKLKAGKKLQVAFPRITEKPMNLFYGQKNAQGQMNWTGVEVSFKTTAKQQAPADTLSTVKRKGKKSEIDAILEYADTGYGGYTPTKAEREEREQERRKYEQQQKVYDAIALDKMGWINCDWIMDITQKMKLGIQFDSKDSVSEANVFVVFKDMNSLIQEYYTAGNAMNQLNDLPLGYSVKVIAYTIKNDKIYSGMQQLRLNKNETLKLDLKETSEADLKQMLKP